MNHETGVTTLTVRFPQRSSVISELTLQVFTYIYRTVASYTINLQPLLYSACLLPW